MMNNEGTLRFKYKVPVRGLVIAMLVGIAFTAMMVYFAQTPVEPRLTGPLAGAIPPSAMPIIYWGFAAFFFIATIYLLFAIVKHSNAVNYIELGSNSALVQIKSASMSMSQVTIPYQSIKTIQVNNLQKHQTVLISSSVNDLVLDSRSFSTPSDFTAFISALQHRRHSSDETIQHSTQAISQQGDTVRFKYKASRSNLVYVIAATMAATLFMACHAYINRSASVLVLIIYLALTAFFGFKTIKLLSTARKRAKEDSYVELGPSGVLIPWTPFSMLPSTIPYVSIESVQVNNVKKHNLVIISSSAGKSILDSRCFLSENDFTSFLAVLQQRRDG